VGHRPGCIRRGALVKDEEPMIEEEGLVR
jgi:hypothetical protein